MSDETRAQFEQALAGYDGSPADRADLTAAARAHVGASRPLGKLLTEYQAAQTAWQDGAGREVVTAAAQEMVPVRQATAILNGMFPDSAPVVTAEHNPELAASNGEEA